MDSYQDDLYSIYQSTISTLPRLGTGLIVIVFLYFILRYLRKRIVTFLRSRAQDKLLADFTQSVLTATQYTILFLVFLYSIGKTGIVASLLGAAGISAFVIGFAFKDIGENFLAGIIMAFDRPFRIGDTIEINGIVGKITTMSLRHTHVKTFDGKDVYVPNGQIIKNPLYNYTIDGYLRQQYEITVNHDVDLPLLRSWIIEEVSKIPGVLTQERSPDTYISEVVDARVVIVIQFWVDTFGKYSAVEARTQAIEATIRRLLAENVTLPEKIIQLTESNG